MTGPGVECAAKSSNIPSTEGFDRDIFRHGKPVLDRGAFEADCQLGSDAVAMGRLRSLVILRK